MDIVFKALLAFILLAAALSIIVMAVVQHRRVVSMGAMAHGMNMLFSTEDPFDLMRRYPDLVLFSAGHSGRVSNVAYGRVDSLPVRAFDFRYEAGHGTRRITRSYSVVVVETPSGLEPLLMWNSADLDCAPPAAQVGCSQIGRWLLQGSPQDARRLEAMCEDLSGEAISIQRMGDAIALFAPARSAGLYRKMIPTVRRMAGKEEISLASV